MKPVNTNYDPAGRVTQQTAPDHRITGFAYDANGNLTAITPPGREAHVFRYNVVDLEDEYTPPDLVTGRTITQYNYNLDKQLQRITRPDGQSIDLAYDTAGRLSRQVVPNGTYQFDYHATAGQLSTLTAPGGQTLNYGYDGFLPISETWSGSVNGSVSRSYDHNFSLTEISADGQVIGFGSVPQKQAIYFHAPSPARKSAIKSSTSSKPTAMRSKPSPMPAF